MNPCPKCGVARLAGGVNQYARIECDCQCPRCGRQQELLVITMFGDKEPRYAPGLRCNCPGPRCPFSHGRLDDQGRCSDIYCFLYFHVVPIPEVA